MSISEKSHGGDDADTQQRTVDALVDAARMQVDAVNPVEANDATVMAPIREGPGARIGPYKLLQQIGEGGFGVVFMAEQIKPVVRRVALKIIKLGMDTRQVVARFEAERQALAMMDHPNIARVLDAGATESGRPYFVMELVRGDPITEYCDINNVSTTARLELFTQVCHAVQHAHQKGIIHRDIKPSNVLVTVADGRPIPKVIDFGIAKATSAKLTEKTLFTEHRALIGTPAYMSPEQAEMSGVDIDTRSDIYSLGVLLYELLTGTTPFDPQHLRSAAYGEIQRIIREVEPPKPSTRFSTLKDSATQVAARRHTEPAKLSALLRGDLDWIVMKALEKDRTRRYETANGLAMDVIRHLSGEAVMAAPPSTAYRMKKFVRRNRSQVAGVALVGLALVLGMAVASWQWFEASQARRMLETTNKELTAQRDKSEIVAEFMEDILNGAGPAIAQGRDTTMLKFMMDQAADKLERNALKNSPEAELRLRRRIGMTYAAMGQLDKADRMLKPTEAMARELFPDSQNLALVLAALGDVRNAQGELEPAVALLKEAVAIQRRVTPGDHIEVARLLNQLGYIERRVGDTGKAETNLREAVAMWRRLNDDEMGTVFSTTHLVMTLMDQGKLAEALTMQEEAVTLLRTLSKGDTPIATHALNMMASIYGVVGRRAEEERMLREALAMCRRLYTGDHTSIASVLNNLALSLGNQGRYTDAESPMRESLEMTRRMFAGDHPDLVSRLNNMADLEGKNQRLDDSERLYREALAMAERVYRAREHDIMATIKSNLGLLLQTMGRLDEAEPLLRSALELRHRLAPGDHPNTAMVINNLALLEKDRGKLLEAEKLFRDALAMQTRLMPADNVNRAISMGNLTDVLLRQKKFEEGAALAVEHVGIFQRVGFPQLSGAIAQCSVALLYTGEVSCADEAEILLRQCVALRLVEFPDGHPQVWLRHNAESMLGEALMLQGKFAEAEPLIVGSYEAMKDDPAVPSPEKNNGYDRKKEALQRVARLYQTWDKAKPGHGYDKKAQEWALRPEGAAGE